MHKALHIFLHPRRAARLLNEKEAEAAELHHTLLCTNADMEELRNDLCRECEKNERLKTEAEGLRREISRLKEEAAAERALHEEQERKILEINDMFERVSELTENYEKRIASLKHRLADARKALNRSLLEADEELRPVPPVHTRRTEAALPPPPPAPEEAADWYVTPPEL